MIHTNNRVIYESIDDGSEKKVALAELMRMHRLIFPFPTSIGLIKLRRLRYLDMEEVTIKIAEQIPYYHACMDTLNHLKEKLKNNMNLTENELHELKRLLTQLKPYAEEFWIRLFVEPQISTREELHAILNALKPHEREKIMSVLVELSRQEHDMHSNCAVLRVMKEFGVKMPDDLTIENITVEQMLMLTQSYPKVNLNNE